MILSHNPLPFPPYFTTDFAHMYTDSTYSLKTSSITYIRNSLWNSSPRRLNDPTTRQGGIRMQRLVCDGRSGRG